MIFTVGLTYSIIAALISIYFLDVALKKGSKDMLLLSLLFVLVSWSGIEWTLWLLGYNLFELVLRPIVPLTSFFVAWTLAIIYIAETRFERKYWVLFLVLIYIISIIAVNCMDCL